MTLNRAAVIVGSVLFVLITAPRTFATPINARLTIDAFGFAPGLPPPFPAHLEGFITLEADSGPFWWQSVQSLLPLQNGFLITSFVGTFNGQPAQLVLDPMRPPWMQQLGALPQTFLLGYLQFQSGGNQWASYPDTTNISNLIIIGPQGNAPASGFAVAIPEFPSVALTGAGLALLICWIRKQPQLLRCVESMPLRKAEG